MMLDSINRYYCFLFYLNLLSIWHLAMASNTDDAELIQLVKIQENLRICQSNETNIETNYDVSNENYCPKTFDGILCWPKTFKNKWAEQRCPDWFIGFYNTKGVAKRFCEPSARWKTKKDKQGRESNITYTDYTDCIKSRETVLYLEHLPKVKLIAKIGFSLSLASLTIAIILLSLLKRLHCPRNILHINLFASFLLFSTIQLIKELTWVSSVGFPKDVIEVQPKTYEMNPNISHWECKLLMSLYRYAESSNHVMVFSEALYLNTLISVSTFNEKNHYKLYIAVGWVGPLIWFIPFIALMARYYENSCWNIETRFTYLYVGPQVMLILSNFAMFINMIRILMLKLKKNNLTESKHYRYKKLAKSTLILLPLFSIYYIAFSVWQPFVTNKLSVEMELIRLYFEIICGSFQGMLISLIFCFFNSEVKSEIRKLIERKILEYDPDSTRRFSRFISNRDKLNSMPSIATQERLRKISSKEISPKSFYTSPMLTKSTPIKSRESSVFFPRQMRRSNQSSTQTELYSNINNLSANRLNLINNSADNNHVKNNNLNNKKTRNFLSLFKRNSNENNPLQHEESRFKIKFKKKDTALTKVDSFKIIKNYMHKNQSNENGFSDENDMNVNEIINVDRQIRSDSLDSLDIIDSNYPNGITNSSDVHTRQFV